MSIQAKLITCVTVALLLTFNLAGQRTNKGLFASIGIGVGYSLFGENYYETRAASVGNNITEFSGFRSVILNSRIGYQITDKVGVSVKNVLFPSTSTVLPIGTNWLGGNVTLGLPNSDNHYFMLGVGKSKYKTRLGIHVNDTVLYNLGFGIILGNALFEIEVYTGKMKEVTDLEPNPFEDKTIEIMPSLTFSYLFSVGN